MTINADGTAYQADRRAALEMTGILPSCPARSGEWREERENPTAARAYFENFEWAQLLLRTSRFDAAGIVISEAAAFSVPALIYAVDGLLLLFWTGTPDWCGRRAAHPRSTAR
jgi:glycosyltransferase involved in cell wall biosynthesis